VSLAPRSTQLDLFKNNLPRKPYCADDLVYGLKIRNIEHAINHRYIQPDHPNSKLWLKFDIDRGTAPDEITDDLNLPCPTIFIQNPKNGHAHALYALENPVHLNPNSSTAALRYAAAVDVSLSLALGADPNYVGLITKNPLHESWRTYGLAGSYSLAELSDYLDLTQFNDRRKKLPEIGLGRNVLLFETLRSWAYKAIRQGWPQYDRWIKACEDRAQGINNGFVSPLHWSEIKATAKSVAKWTHANISATGFSQWQSVMGKKGGDKNTPEQQSLKGIASGEARWVASEDKRASAILLRSNGMSYRAIAAELGVTHPTVMAWCQGGK